MPKDIKAKLQKADLQEAKYSLEKRGVKLFSAANW